MKIFTDAKPMGFYGLSALVGCNFVAMAVAAPPPGFELTWADEFDGNKLDLTKWKHRAPGPRKDGVNVPEAFSLNGSGHMHITVQKVGEQYHTGMICTEDSLRFKFGYVEARVQFQTQEGWWSAFWLTTPRVSDPERGKGIDDDTRTNGAEIDIFEYLRKKGDQLQHAFHWNGYGKLHKHTGHVTNAPGLSKGFHTVGVEWRPDGYTFYIDGAKSWETKQAISHAEQYLILSSEVGDWGGDISKAKLPDSVIFDYVRVYRSKVPYPLEKLGAAAPKDTEKAAEGSPPR